ncbi:MAG: inner membrane protein YqiK, partial [Pseudomonadota bacterium]
MPEIMSHMMKPIEKIDSIRINHVSGFGNTQGGAGPGGSASDEGGSGGGKPPVTQVMDSILGMALQLPALKSIGDQIGVDLSGSIDAASGKSKPGGHS